MGIDFGVISLGTILQLGVTLVTIGIAWGIFKAKIKALEEKIDELRSQKAELTRQTVGQHERRITALEAEQTVLRTSITEIKSKVELIYEWVRDQKEGRR